MLLASRGRDAQPRGELKVYLVKTYVHTERLDRLIEFCCCWKYLCFRFLLLMISYKATCFIKMLHKNTQWIKTIAARFAFLAKTCF